MVNFMKESMYMKKIMLFLALVTCWNYELNATSLSDLKLSVVEKINITQASIFAFIITLVAKNYTKIPRNWSESFQVGMLSGAMLYGLTHLVQYPLSYILDRFYTNNDNPSTIFNTPYVEAVESEEDEEEPQTLDVPVHKTTILRNPYLVAGALTAAVAATAYALLNTQTDQPTPAENTDDGCIVTNPTL